VGPNTLKIYYTIFRFPDVIQNFLASTQPLFHSLIQRPSRHPSHESKQFTAISSSLALLLLRIRNYYIISFFSKLVAKRKKNLSRWSAFSLVLKQDFTAAKHSIS
jgi:hypothetical protein